MCMMCRYVSVLMHGRFVIVRVWKNGADMLDPSDSIRVHVDADCGVTFLPHEEMPDWKGALS